MGAKLTMEFLRIRLIRQAHRKLHVLTGTPATRTVLKPRMELYGILLEDVADIRRNLVAYLAEVQEGKFRGR
jgi:hypothetical protein